MGSAVTSPSWWIEAAAFLEHPGRGSQPEAGSPNAESGPHAEYETSGGESAQRLSARGPTTIVRRRQLTEVNCTRERKDRHARACFAGMTGSNSWEPCDDAHSKRNRGEAVASPRSVLCPGKFRRLGDDVALHLRTGEAHELDRGAVGERQYSIRSPGERRRVCPRDKDQIVGARQEVREHIV